MGRFRTPLGTTCPLHVKGNCLHSNRGGRDRAEPDGTRAETTFRLSPKGTSPFKSAGESVQSFAGSRGVRISISNDGYTTFRGSVKSTGYPLHSLVSPSLPLTCVTGCHQVPNELYQIYCFVFPIKLLVIVVVSNIPLKCNLL